MHNIYGKIGNVTRTMCYILMVFYSAYIAVFGKFGIINLFICSITLVLFTITYICDVFLKTRKIQILMDLIFIFVYIICVVAIAYNY